MSGPESMLKELGEPLVREAFDEVLNSKIPSKRAKNVIKTFAKKWKDYARPALMMLVCEAVGGNPKLVAPAAKAMVLTAGAFDIHDDIIDKSFVRTQKHKKTLLGLYGSDTMLLVGDALMIGALTYLPSLHGVLPVNKVNRILQTIKNGLFELGSAELEELSLIRKYDTTPRAYLNIVRMKAADVESYTKIGAIIGGADEETISSFAEFGRLIGMITILRDDVEDTFNDYHELLSRITKESLPLPIIFSLHDPEMVRLLKQIKEPSSEYQLQQIINIVERNRGFENTKKQVDFYISKIKITLSRLEGTEKILSLLTL